MGIWERLNFRTVRLSKIGLFYRHVKRVTPDGSDEVGHFSERDTHPHTGSLLGARSKHAELLFLGDTARQTRLCTSRESNTNAQRSSFYTRTVVRAEA